MKPNFCKSRTLRHHENVLGNGWNKEAIKSARVIGDAVVIGKYHPWWRLMLAAVYIVDTIVRM